MSIINILSPHVADLIAAGEVVECPASIIKELLGNSYDTGAKHVTCKIQDGGATYIRVTDDGCGLAPVDAGIAFVRHATSKRSDESGFVSSPEEERGKQSVVFLIYILYPLLFGASPWVSILYTYSLSLLFPILLLSL